MRIAYTLIGALCAAILLIVAVPANATGAPPAETVRAVAVDGDRMCSAVVIAPGFALTARHCLKRGLTVDTLPVAYISAGAPENEDIGLLAAPGLQCPCASFGVRPAKGDTVVAVGFPLSLQGQRRVTASAAVQLVGTIAPLAPWVNQPGYSDAIYIVTDKPIIDNGDSGGGLFALQGGEWNLVGISAVGVPKAPMTDEEQASGFVPVDLATKFIPKF